MQEKGRSSDGMNGFRKATGTTTSRRFTIFTGE